MRALTVPTRVRVQATGHTENQTAGNYEFKELRVSSNAVVNMYDTPSLSSRTSLVFSDTSRLLFTISNQANGVEPVVSAKTIVFDGTSRMQWGGRITVTAIDELRLASGVQFIAQGGGYSVAGVLPGCPTDGTHGVGGSYGGYGGRSSHYTTTTVPCGSFMWPHERGAGGWTWSGHAKGGNGGGSIAFIANATIDTVLHIDGTVQVSGNAGVNGGNQGSGGGGAGGGVVVAARYLRGAGAIVANGGNGGTSGSYSYRGGGGSGGRIAFHVDVNEWAGNAQACGGYYGTSSSGVFGHGSPGTVYWAVGKDKALRTRTMYVDNCGTVGASAHLTEGLDLYTFELVHLSGGGELSVVRMLVGRLCCSVVVVVPMFAGTVVDICSACLHGYVVHPTPTPRRSPMTGREHERYSR